MATKYKTKAFGRCISALLALVLVFTTVFSSLTVVSFAQAPTAYTDITADSSASVNITTAGEFQYFRFIPAQSGNYTFYSSDSNSTDTYGALLDSNGSTLYTDDDSGGDYNFSITYDCVAGETYYVQARFYSSSKTGSYTLNVRSNFTTEPTTGLIITEGSNNYSLFNSGVTSSSSSYTSPNPAPDTYDNNGYDLYGQIAVEEYSRFRLGLSFTVNTTLTEQATLTVRAYDVDEDTWDCGSGYEYDYIYLVDETTGTSTLLDGHMSGTSNTWTTSSFRIDPSLLLDGHTYHFEFQLTCTGNHSCTYYTVKVRSVDLLVSGEGEGSQTGICYANLTGAITSDGLVSTRIAVLGYDSADYYIEYKAVCAADSTQRGYNELFVNISQTESNYTSEFYLDSGSSRGTYIVTAFIKDTYGTVVATRSITVSYGYCAISYNSNGGSQNLPIDTNNYSPGDVATVLFDYIPSRSGYTFLGWSRDAYATEPEFTVNGNNTLALDTGDVTLYAIWAEGTTPPEETPTEIVTEAPSEAPTESPVTPPAGNVDVWDGTSSSDIGGEGTQNNPYLIYTAEQLAYFAEVTNSGCTFLGTYIKLMSDIDLNGLSWTPIGISQSNCFSGYFDGNNHTIYNMSITGSYQFVGLFGCVSGATISNLALKSVDIYTTLTNNYSVVGGLAAVLDSSSVVDHCSVQGAIVGNNTSTSYAIEAGGLVAVLKYNSVVKNCYANVSIYGSTNGYNAYVGGLVGLTDSNSSGSCVIENCYSVSDVTAVTSASSKYATAGGLVGDMWSSLTVINCFATGNVSASSPYGSSYTGAVLGFQNSGSFSVTNCYYGDINTSNEFSYIYYTEEYNLKNESWLASCLGWDFESIWTIDANTGYEYPIHLGFATSTSHQLSDWIYDIEPTCTTGGHRYKVCTDCGELLASEDVRALSHDFVIIEGTDATCTTDGYAVMACQREGCTYSKHQTIYAEGHSFDSNNVCTKCGFVLVVHEHSYTQTVIDPTCTQVGYTVYVCECGNEYRADYVDQRGHTWNEGVVTTPATCTDDGVMQHTCVNCDAVYEVIIPAGHDWSDTETVEATCFTDGSKTRICNVCGETETVIIPAAHVWDDGYVVVEATCTEAGRTACNCTVCGEYTELEIGVLGHEFVNGSCTRCGARIPDIIKPNEDHSEYGMYFEIDDILSNYGPEYINEYGVLLDYNADAQIKKVAVYLVQEGTMWRRCIACVGDNITYATYVPYLSYDENIYYTGLNHDWINTFRLSENSDGIWCYSNYATIGVNLQDAYGNLLLSLYDIGQAGAKTRIFDDLDEMIAWLKDTEGCIYHTEGEWYIDYYATCGADGLKYTYCTDCGARIEEVIPAEGNHSESDWIVDVYPTATSSGSRHKECYVCYTVLETDVMDVLATLKIEDVVARPDSTVSVTIDIQNNPGIIGAALTFEFDPTLTLISATQGGAWSLLTMTTPGHYDTPCTFVWDGVNVSDYTNGTIVTLTFALPEGAGIGMVYDINAYYSYGNMINAEFENIDVVIEGGSITVADLAGDVNDDGVVDVADVIVLRRYMSSGYDVTINFEQSDMNGDGMITMADIILLRRLITNG